MGNELIHKGVQNVMENGLRHWHSETRTAKQNKTENKWQKEIQLKEKKS